MRSPPGDSGAHSCMRTTVVFALTEMLEGKLIKNFFRDCVRDVKIVVENMGRKGYHVKVQ